MKNTSVKASWMFFGLVMALVVVFSHIFHYESPVPSQKDNTTEKKEVPPSSEHAFFISAPSAPSQSFVPTPVATGILSLPESLSAQAHETFTIHRSPLAPGKLFLTLFRAIIAPNAP